MMEIATYFITNCKDGLMSISNIDSILPLSRDAVSVFSAHIGSMLLSTMGLSILSIGIGAIF